jgi:hypothetical protein
MPLSQHYHAAQSLSPTAARLAARLLDLSVGVPFAWRLSLRMALVERGRLAPPLDATDIAPLRDGNDAPVPAPGSPPLDQARHFIRALHADPAARHDV